MFRRSFWLLASLFLPLLTGCGTTDTPSSASRPDLLGFRTTQLDTAYVGEAYSGPVVVTGGVAPYRLRLISGELPQGLRLVSGGGAAITGTPTAAQTRSFRLEVVDANLSARSQDFTLTVAPLPALDLEAALPPTEIRGETRIPLRVVGPRGVRSLHYTWTLPAGVKVVRVEAGGDLKTMLAKSVPSVTGSGSAALPAPGLGKAAPLGGLGAGKLLGQGSAQSSLVQPPASPATSAAPALPATQAAARATQPQPSLHWSQQGPQLVLGMTFAGQVSSKAPVALVTLAPAGRAPFTLTQPMAGKGSQIRALDVQGAVIRDTLSEAATSQASTAAGKVNTDASKVGADGTSTSDTVQPEAVKAAANTAVPVVPPTTP